jgi:hypothetical protein
MVMDEWSWVDLWTYQFVWPIYPPFERHMLICEYIFLQMIATLGLNKKIYVYTKHCLLSMGTQC